MTCIPHDHNPYIQLQQYWSKSTNHDALAYLDSIMAQINICEFTQLQHQDKIEIFELSRRIARREGATEVIIETDEHGNEVSRRLRYIRPSHLLSKPSDKKRSLPMVSN